MSAKSNNPLIERLLDVQEDGTFIERKAVREDARLAYDKANKEAKAILANVDAEAKKVEDETRAAVDEQAVRKIEAKIKYKTNEAKYNASLACLAGAPKLKALYLEKAAQAEAEASQMILDAEELKKPVWAAIDIAEAMRRESREAAQKALEEAKRDPAVILEDQMDVRLREVLMGMVASGRTIDAVNFAGREGKAKLYWEIRAAAKIKDARMQAASKLFCNDLPKLGDLPEGTAALIKAHDKIVAVDKAGMEIGRFLIGAGGEVMKDLPDLKRNWQAKGANVVKLSAPAAA